MEHPYKIPAAIRAFKAGLQRSSSITTPRPFAPAPQRSALSLRIPLHLDPRDGSAGAEARRAELHMLSAQINPNGFQRPKGWGKKESRRDRAEQRRVAREVSLQRFEEIRAEGIPSKHMHSVARRRLELLSAVV